MKTVPETTIPGAATTGAAIPCTTTASTANPPASRRAWSRLLALSVAEARPQVQVAFLLRFACGTASSASTASLADLPWHRIVTGLLVWECAVVAVYLFNGIADIHGDRLNGLRRPIAQGRLALTAAKPLAAFFAVAAVSGATLLGNAFMLATAGALLLGYLYSGRPFDLRKRPIAAGALAMTGGLITYLAGGLAAEGHLSTAWTTLAIAMSLWMGLIGATVKDFADRVGDAATGRHTLIDRFGEAAARRVVMVAAPAIGSALVVAAWLFAPILLFGAVAVLVGAVVVSLRTWRSGGTTQRGLLSGPYRAFMATQLTAHCLVLATVLASQVVP